MNAPVVKLADTPDLGSGPKGCRFKSCQVHHIDMISLTVNIICALYIFIYRCADNSSGKPGFVRIRKNIYSLNRG